MTLCQPFWEGDHWKGGERPFRIWDFYHLGFGTFENGIWDFEKLNLAFEFEIWIWDLAWYQIWICDFTGIWNLDLGFPDPPYTSSTKKYLQSQRSAIFRCCWVMIIKLHPGLSFNLRFYRHLKFRFGISGPPLHKFYKEISTKSEICNIQMLLMMIITLYPGLSFKKITVVHVISTSINNVANVYFIMIVDCK